MARPSTLAIAAAAGLLVAGCTGGGILGPGTSLPNMGDGVQTVSDAADALDLHRSSASESARAAIVATNAVGSFVREVSNVERDLAGSPRAGFGESMVRSSAAVRTDAAHLSATRYGLHAPFKNGFAFRTSSQLSSAGGGRILSSSQLVVRPSLGGVNDYCQGSAGFSPTGIPSLDESFGWQGGALGGGARAADGHGLATWSAVATGESVQGPIGTLRISRNATGESCPMTSPSLHVSGATLRNAFAIPVSATFDRGRLLSLAVSNAKLDNGETLNIATAPDRRQVSVNGVIVKGRTQVATFRVDALGNGALTITSTGAQYVVADWIVVST
ncbi:MAG: hypothetical protein WA814_12255 [Candidatus Baltobacteraceae bacterium]